MLQEVRDTNDNYIKYTYNRDNNQLYPYKITYTGHGSTDGISTLTFATSTRPDTRVSYASGFAATTTKVISEIDVLVNGTTVRKYPLTYGVGNNGYRSLLTSVQQQGYDDNGNLTSLPATTFGYTSSSTQFYSPSPITDEWAQSHVIADTNGNGINDVNSFYYSSVDSRIHSNIEVDNTSNLTSYVPPDYWAGFDGSYYNPEERGVRYVDVNGDGKPDVIMGYHNYTNGTTTNEMYVNGSSGTSFSFTASTTWNGTIPTFDVDGSGSVHNDTTGIFGDVNGDGLPDYEQNLSGYAGPAAYLGNGSAWDSTSNFAPVSGFPVFGPNSSGQQLIDVNGDGLDDWVQSDGVYLNNGTGWQSVADTHWSIGTSTLYASPGGGYYDRGIRFIDMNGDGLPDYVRSYNVGNDAGCTDLTYGELASVHAVYLNTGNGWATTTSPYTLPADILYAHYTNFGGGACIWNDGGRGPRFDEYSNWYGNGQMAQDVLANITNSKGGKTSVTYANSTSAAGNSNLPYSLLVTSAVGIYDGKGNAATTTYTYTGGKQYTAQGVRDRKFAGFAIATSTAPDSVVATYYDQGDDINTAIGEQSDGYAQINRPFRTDVYDQSNNLKQRTYNRWDTIQHGNSTFIGLGQQMVEDFAADLSHRDKATVYSYSSTTDDVTSIAQYGEVVGSTDGTFTDTGTDKRTTIISYVASSSANMNLPTEKTLYDYSSTTVSDQKLYYDNLAFGLLNAGNNTKQEDWISGSTYASSTKTYNMYGLVATSTDRRGNATSYVYDANNLYVATTTNPLLQKTQFLYNYANGKARWKSDPNSSLTKNVFGGLGRLTEIDVSSTSTPTTYATTTTFVYVDSTSTSYIKRSDWQTAATTTDSYQFFDGLNRIFQVRRVSPTSGTYNVIDRIYNPAGLMASTSFPYSSSGASSTAATATSALYTNYYYDALQRITSEVNAVGTKTNSYSSWTVTTTDPNGGIKDYWSDAFGNLVNVVEHISASSIATTTYSYDAQNNLATTTDASGNVRGFTYDGLGRRLVAQDLHAPADSTFGIWTYTYDDAGNVTAQSDPKAQVVNRAFDALNRMLTEDYTGQSGTEVNLVYDSCTNGIGYLCSASSTAATSTNKYDILGRITFATTTILGSAYSTQYSYDRQGDVTSQIYPNGSQVNFSYNLAGLPSGIQRKVAGGSFSDIVSSFAYSPTGQVTTTVFGSGASTTRTYDANALYRLSQLQTWALGGSKIQDFAYTYSAIGNITQIINSANASSSATTAYAYDAVNRLLTAAAPSATSSPYTQTFSYDQLGSILSNALTNGSSSVAISPTIMDTLNLPTHTTLCGITSDSFSYTVPSGGSNKLLLVLVRKNLEATAPTSATLNGVSLATFTRAPGTENRGGVWYTYLAAPTSGTFQITFSSNTCYDVAIMTLQNAAQTSPIDAAVTTYSPSASSETTSATTTVANDLLVGFGARTGSVFTSYGAGETQITNYGLTAFGDYVGGSWKAAASTPGLESMTGTGSGSADFDWSVVAVKSSSPGGASSASTNTYTYAGTGDANPHAPTQIANGLSTTTYAYDNDGNVTQKTTDGTTTTYIWDYANRLTALGVGGATTTYGYDAFGARAYQIVATTSTSTYPFKFFSVASTTKSSTNWATSTEYIFNGDTLLSTIDQQFKNGTATGTAKTRYIHPDHLGSTNVVTNESGALVQTLDYYPYGATRISNSTSTNEKRKYIGQFTDDSGLDYLNARYYSSDRGQFISQDPVFWEIGLTQDGKNALSNPQALNSYGYANDNPITGKDPSGRQLDAAFDAATDVANSAPSWMSSVGSALSSWSGSIAAGTGAAIYNASKNSTPGAPGYGPLQESMVQNSRSSDFQLGGPLGKPPGRWGPLLTTVVGTGLTSLAGCQLLGCDLDWGTQASTQSQSSLPYPMMMKNLNTPAPGRSGGAYGGPAQSKLSTNAGGSSSSRNGSANSSSQPTYYPGGTVFSVPLVLHAIVPH